MVTDSVLGMAISPDTSHPTFDGAARRPVLGAAGVAVDVLCQGEEARLWTLSDPEVAATVCALSEVVAAAKAQLVLALAEAKERSLGVGQGLGAVDWARSVAPSLPTRDLLDADVVATVMAGSSSVGPADRRLDEVVEAVNGACSPDLSVRAESLAVG